METTNGTTVAQPIRILQRATTSGGGGGVTANKSGMYTIQKHMFCLMHFFHLLFYHDRSKFTAASMRTAVDSMTDKF